MSNILLKPFIVIDNFCLFSFFSVVEKQLNSQLNNQTVTVLFLKWKYKSDRFVAETSGISVKTHTGLGKYIFVFLLPCNEVLCFIKKSDIYVSARAHACACVCIVYACARIYIYLPAHTPICIQFRDIS